MKFAFFGTDEFSVTVLESLKEAGKIPALVVTAPDRPAGRGQKMQKSDAKVWAEENSIDVKQPEVLDEDFQKELKEVEWDFFVVASYGKIMPKEVVEMPRLKSLNVHPSLLPLYRGASPIESAILDDSKETGVTIMLMDEKMDHGPILNQEFVMFDEWPTKKEVENQLATIGGEMLSQTIDQWMNDDIDPQEQDHDMATFTKKITKEMGKIDINNLSRETFLKIQALNPWPGAFFFIKKNGEELRVKVTEASWKDGQLDILKVVPAGKGEMSYADFKKGL